MEISRGLWGGNAVQLLTGSPFLTCIRAERQAYLYCILTCRIEADGAHCGASQIYGTAGICARKISDASPRRSGQNWGRGSGSSPMAIHFVLPPPLCPVMPYYNGCNLQISHGACFVPCFPDGDYGGLGGLLNCRAKALPPPSPLVNSTTAQNILKSARYIKCRLSK